MIQRFNSRDLDLKFALLAVDLQRWGFVISVPRNGYVELLNLHMTRSKIATGEGATYQTRN